MNAKSWLTLLGIAAFVAVLGLATRSDPDAEPVEAAPTSELPMVLDFGRGQCIPCIKMMPVLEALRETYDGVVEVRYIDLGKAGSEELAAEHEVTIIPTQIFIDSEGNELFRHQGFFDLVDIEAKLQEFGWIPSR